MASVNIGGDLSYIIRLDSIDLAYLGKYVRSPLAEKAPLWTRRRLDGKSEYCRVQINTQDDSEDCYSEPFDTYKCHICNVRVPTMCYKEHNESEQHETTANISKKILERVSKQINTPVINNDEDIVKDVYFCAPCSKIVKIENKNSHESSSYHIKSIKNISIITEYYNILKKKESSDDGNDLNDEKDEERSKANNNHDTNDENLCNNLDSDDESVDQSSVTNKLTRIPRLGNTKNDNQPKSYEKTENFEEYLKEMIKKYNLKVNLPVINGEYISIVAPNGDTVKVPREHFQSYQHLQTNVYCQMCEIWIPQDTRPHDVTEFHVRNILKPINANFTRTIAAHLSHCVPCNEVVLAESNHHTMNDDHNVTVPMGGMKLHVDEQSHKKVMSELCSENNGQSSAKPSSVAQNGSSVNTNAENVRFAGANPTTSAESSLSNALNISVHQMDAYYNLLEYTNVAKTKVRCKICFEYMVFNEKNIIDHMESSRHIEVTTKKKKQMFNQLLSYTDEAKNTLKCVICDVIVPDNERNIIEHMMGRNHQVAENELLVYHVITKESSGYRCECCDEDITDYFEHINGRTHTLKFPEQYEIDKRAMRKYVYEDDTDNNVARRHRERYKNLLKYNDINKINGGKFYCGICHIQFGRISEIYHVLGERHALKLNETGIWYS